MPCPGNFGNDSQVVAASPQAVLALVILTAPLLCMCPCATQTCFSLVGYLEPATPAWPQCRWTNGMSSIGSEESCLTKAFHEQPQVMDTGAEQGGGWKGHGGLLVCQSQSPPLQAGSITCHAGGILGLICKIKSGLLGSGSGMCSGVLKAAKCDMCSSSDLFIYFM